MLSLIEAEYFNRYKWQIAYRSFEFYQVIKMIGYKMKS